MKRPAPGVVRWVSLLLAAGLYAPAMVAAAEPGPEPSKLTVYHWWTSPSESAALGALVKLFKQKYPSVDVNAVSLGGGSVRPQFAMIKRAIVDSKTLDAFQANAGNAAQVFFDAGLLSPVDDIWAGDKLEQVIPPVIRDLNKFEGHYYSVPVSVHRTNVVWYNKPLLDKYKIDPSALTTWEAFLKAAQTLKAAGVESPIQMGTTWTAAHVFECIVASLGIAAYEDWINGKITAADDARVLRALTIFQGYAAYVNKDHGTLAWDVAIHRVMKGEGAFCIMGDWANGEFRVAGLKYGKDYGAILVPETKGLYGLGVDTFQHPRGLPDPLNSTRWLSLVASRQGQDAFNPLKGSVPARTDADLSAYDPYQRSAIADFKAAAHMYPNSAAALPEAFNTQVNDSLVAFMLDEDVKEAAAAMTGAATRLNAAGKYRRVWSLK
jgi:glucose/mannose transport system substrate-binding protein